MRSKWSKPSSSGLVKTVGRAIGELLLRASYRVRKPGVAPAAPRPWMGPPARTIRGPIRCRQRQRGNQGPRGRDAGPKPASAGQRLDEIRQREGGAVDLRI